MTITVSLLLFGVALLFRLYVIACLAITAPPYEDEEP